MNSGTTGDFSGQMASNRNHISPFSCHSMAFCNINMRIWLCLSSIGERSVDVRLLTTPLSILKVKVF